MSLGDSLKPNRIFLPFSFIFSLIFLTNIAFAHCPLCSAATGAAVAVTRFYGVDDLIVGTFIGGFIISTAYWSNRYLMKRNKKKQYVQFQLPIIIIVSLLLTLVTFYFAGLLKNSNPAFLVFGIDKIAVGSFIGSMITIFAFWFNDFLRKMNGKSFIPFQGILLSLTFLSLTSLVYYLVGVV